MAEVDESRGFRRQHVSEGGGAFFLTADSADNADDVVHGVARYYHRDGSLSAADLYLHGKLIEYPDCLLIWDEE